MNLTQAEIQHMVDTMTKAERQAHVQDMGYRQWIAANCRGTMEMATGTGKTRIGIRAAAELLIMNPQAIIYIVVPTEVLRDTDWPNEMRAMGYDDLHTKVNLVCWASLTKIKPKQDVDLVVLDEVHHITPRNCNFFASETYKVFKILGLTATLPGEYWQNEKDKMMIINHLCPSVFEVTVEEGIALRIITEFELYILEFDLDDKIRNVQGGTKKKPHMTTEYGRYKELTKALQRTVYMKQDGAKFGAIQRRTEFLMNLRSKIVLANNVMAEIMKKGERTLFFCGSIEQSVQICGENVYNSGTNNDKLDAFCNKEIHYLGTCQALNEGKNIPDVDQSVIVQGSSKELTLIQRIGRNVRWRENHVARIVLLVAKGTADEKWSKMATENIDKKRIKRFYVKPV